MALHFRNNGTTGRWELPVVDFPLGWVRVDFENSASRQPFTLCVTARFGKNREPYRVTLSSPRQRGEAFIKFPGWVETLAVEGATPQAISFRSLATAGSLALSLMPILARFLVHPKRLVTFVRQLIETQGQRRLVRALIQDLVFQSGECVKNEYAIWVENYDTIDDSKRDLLRKQFERLSSHPKFSVILPVYNTPEPYLTRAIESVTRQLYPYWELCIADDNSSLSSVKATLQKFEEHPRIKITRRPINGHISEASNSALELATGDFVVFLDHDDELSENALLEVAARLDRQPDLDLIYSDEDKIDSFGHRFEPHFKTEWNPDLFLSYNLITHLACIRRSLVNAVSGFRRGYEGSQDYDLFLRVIAHTSPDRIGHIPKILYHWRAIAGSTALGPGAKGYAHENARRSIREYLLSQGVEARVTEGYESYHRVVYPKPNSQPLVSIMICTRDKKDLLTAIVHDLLHNTDYDPLEILIVDNQSSEPETIDYLKAISSHPKVRVLPFNHPFNFSAMNNFAAREARGDILAFLNNDLRVIAPNWLDEMVRVANQKGVGAVGAKLYYADNTIQHAGIVLGIGGVAGHPQKHQPANTGRFIGRANVMQAYTAVTGACLVIRRTIFQEVAGFDEVNLPVAFNDVDLGIRLRKAGYRNLWTPYAELYHLESATRGSDPPFPHGPLKRVPDRELL
ncbi:MAG: glycosyltransferase family 2 protein [Deltaproteobacteria bacterium]|nr:glycosyltransferase family 2 protein [Deltaproteobacteria bacterium]